MKILVLGGTGTISSHLVPRLLECGDRLTLLSRGPRRQPYLGAVEHISVDRFRDGLKPLAGRAFDAVIDNIAYEPNVYGPGRCSGQAQLVGSTGLDGEPILLPDDLPAFHLAGHNVMVYAEGVALAQVACLGNPNAGTRDLP